MPDALKVACIQMTASPEIGANLKTVEGFIREAAAGGAKFIATPENTCQMRKSAKDKLGLAKEQGAHEGVKLFAELSKELGVWLLAGSFSVRTGADRLLNRSLLFSDKGDIAATYDKIHMFDVDLPTGERHRESDVVQPGDKAVVAKTPWGGIGMTICYDVRFGYLYRDLAKAGADIITVPAAFTVPTGKAHWATLLRARAIETGSFILAPGQVGEHEGGRKTWGHSMIIGPWGEILAEAGEQTGIISAGLYLGDVKRAREAIPALKHDRKYTIS